MSNTPFTKKVIVMNERRFRRFENPPSPVSIQICPEMPVVKCTQISISGMMCLFALLPNFNIQSGQVLWGLSFSPISPFGRLLSTRLLDVTNPNSVLALVSLVIMFATLHTGARVLSHSRPNLWLSLILVLFFFIYLLRN